MFFNPVFLMLVGLALLALLVCIGLVIFASFPVWLPALVLVAAVAVFVWVWGPTFLVQMVVDFDAKNGDGIIRIQRQIPSLTMPEQLEFPFDEALDGLEIDTSNFFSTLISTPPLNNIKAFTVLKQLVFGDITLRNKGNNVKAVMCNLQNPAGLKDRLSGYRKKRDEYRKKKKEVEDKAKEAERKKEDLERMILAVAEGIKKAQQEGTQVLINTTQPVAVVPMDTPTQQQLPSNAA
jgi:hypothetical protein